MLLSKHNLTLMMEVYPSVNRGVFISALTGVVVFGVGVWLCVWLLKKCIIMKKRKVYRKNIDGESVNEFDLQKCM